MDHEQPAGTEHGGTTGDDGTAGWPFDADPARFRLAAAALRIRMAGLHDPMVAVTSSDVRPLPHQIRAVYGEWLPRTPLRFLVADDTRECQAFTRLLGRMDTQRIAYRRAADRRARRGVFRAAAA